MQLSTRGTRRSALATFSAVAGALAVTLAVGLAGCAPAEEDGVDAAQAEEWEYLEGAHEELQAKRAELADLNARLEAGVEAIELEEGAEQTAEEVYAELESQAQAADSEVNSQANEFMNRLVAYINSMEMEVGVEPTAEQQAAFRMKSTEDLVYAQEYVDEGGDYARAQDIIEQALELDPENPELQERLAWIQEMRYPTEERFAQVETGMTEREVEEILGPVNIHNTREFSDTRKGWFYKKNPETSEPDAPPAGVYFQLADGQWTVYQALWDIEGSG